MLGGNDIIAGVELRSEQRAAGDDGGPVAGDDHGGELAELVREIGPARGSERGQASVSGIL
jgi:hypothetical protein